MSTEIRPFCVEDGVVLQGALRPQEGGARTQDAYRDYLRSFSHRGPAVTGWVNGKPVACGGICLQWDGVGEAWILCGKDVEKIPVTAIRQIVKHLELFTRDLGLWRVQATVCAEWEMARRFVERLGFKAEGRLERYMADGKDAIMYAKLIGD